jgi:hypothetical protein
MALVLNHSASRGTTKVVLLGIANHDGDGGAWPSVATLARYANVDARTVRRSIRELVAAGELHVSVQAGGMPETPDHARTNRYDVLVACPAGCDGTTKHRVTPTSGGDASARGGTDAHVRGGGTPTSAEPSFNRPGESSGGSSDLDSESRPAFAGETQPADPDGMPPGLNSAERADYRLLADHMIGYEEHVPIVWHWMRTGTRPRDKDIRPQPPIGKPGAHALRKHAKPTKVAAVSEWQGYFRRHFAEDGASVPRVKDHGPRAA